MQTKTVIHRFNKMALLIMLGLSLLIHCYCVIDIYIYALVHVFRLLR
jgi:hypothetical protein